MSRRPTPPRVLRFEDAAINREADAYEARRAPERPSSDPMIRGRRKHWWSPMRYETGRYVGNQPQWTRE